MTYKLGLSLFRLLITTVIMVFLILGTLDSAMDIKLMQDKVKVIKEKQDKHNAEIEKLKKVIDIS